MVFSCLHRPVLDLWRTGDRPGRCLFVRGTTFVSLSTISGNRATAGGGPFVAPFVSLSIDDSSVSRNVAVRGGGAGGSETSTSSPRRSRRTARRHAPRGIDLDLQEGIAQGDGADQVSGIEGVQGSAFGDNIVGNGADNFFLLGGGDDVGRWRADTLDGGSGDDVLAGGPGSDTLDGDWGDDSVAGGPAADTIAGGRGRMDRCRTDPTDSVNSCELPW